MIVEKLKGIFTIFLYIILIRIVLNGGVYSGFKDDKIVSYCVELFDDIVKNIENKTARRYFLRKARKLEMHDGLLLRDFLKPEGDRIDWDKVKDYEKEQRKNGNLYSKKKIL